MERKKVQLVLGSGGARGVAHIGVIEMLIEEGYEIVEVVGCSMGAVVGGMYCSGHLPEYKEWLLKQSKTDVYRMFDFAFSKKGLFKGERIFTVLQQMTGNRLIEELPIEFTAVATDILTRTEIHFRSGDLYKALRASTGIPGAFTPVADDQYLYVDGGVLNPLPISVLERRDDTIIVAVTLNGTFANASIEKTPAPEADEAPRDMLSRLQNFFFGEQKPETQPEVVEKEIKAAVPIPSFSMFELFNLSIDATLHRLTEVTLQAHPVDILVEIPNDICGVFEFYRSADLIEIGRERYKKAVEKQALSVKAE